jgi:hypothetical protein
MISVQRDSLHCGDRYQLSDALPLDLCDVQPTYYCAKALSLYDRLRLFDQRFYHVFGCVLSTRQLFVSSGDSDGCRYCVELWYVYSVGVSCLML